MSRRPESTVILITDSAAYRADFRAGSRQPIGLASVEKLVDDSIANTIRQLEDPARNFGRKVILLSTSVWAQTIDVPKLSIDDLATAELANVLKFEAETLIGIEADQMAIGWTDLDCQDDLQRFWINAIALPDWMEIVQFLVHEKRSKSVRLAHPVGTADSLFFEHSPRLEQWGNTISRISANGEVQALSESGNQNQRWPGELGFSSLQEAHQLILLLAPGSGHVDSSAGHGDGAIDLSDPQTLKHWMGSVLVRSNDQRGKALPWIQLSKTTRAFRVSSALKIAVALLVCALCVWHFTWIKSRQHQIRDQITSLKQPAIEKQKFDSMLQAVLTKRAQAKLEATESKLNLEKVRYLFARQVDRIPRLLQQLNVVRTQELVVKQIEPHKKGLLVSGVSLNGESAPLMANRLRDVASAMGWKTRPATQNGEMKLTSGGPWRFAILLEDVGPFPHRKEGAAVAGLWSPYLRTDVAKLQETISEIRK